MPSPSSVSRDEPVKSSSSKAATPAAGLTTGSSKAKPRRGSVDVVQKPVQKISLFGTTERLSTRSDLAADLKDDNDFDDESEMTSAADDSNAKRSKVNRTSQSNDDSQLKNSVKRKSTGSGDTAGGPSSKMANLAGESASGESSINDGDDMTVKSEPDIQER